MALKSDSMLRMDGKSYILPFILITCCFALWGFANDITNPMVKAFSKIFRMSVTDGALVQVAFYGGYFAMAFPAAMFIKKYSFKAGMWVLEECMKQWNEREAKEYKYEDIVCMANEIPSFLSLIDPDHEMFRRPDNMPEAIKSYCRKTGQHVPENDPEMVECIFASLALKYKYTIDSLQEITGKQINTLHIIGGGSKNDLMSRYSCDATGLDVITGPAEGASFGNILVQAAADNEIKSLPDIRKTMYNSIATKSFKPRNTEIWERAYKDFRKLASL